MVECERVAGGRPTMQDHLLVMVLAETLTSAESTALTFDFAHTLQLVQILYVISTSFCMFHHLFVIIYTVSSSFCNNVTLYPDCSRTSEQQPQFFGISPVAALQVSMERFQPSREFVKPLALDKTWKYS